MEINQFICLLDKQLLADMDKKSLTLEEILTGEIKNDVRQENEQMKNQEEKLTKIFWKIYKKEQPITKYVDYRCGNLHLFKHKSNFAFTFSITFFSEYSNFFISLNLFETHFGLDFVTKEWHDLLNGAYGADYL